MDLHAELARLNALIDGTAPETEKYQGEIIDAEVIEHPEPSDGKSLRLGHA